MTELSNGIIRDVKLIKVGVVGIGLGAGATTASAVLAREFSKEQGMSCYIGNATKTELGLSKRMEKGHVVDKIYWARSLTKNIDTGYIVFDSPDDWENMDLIVAVLDPLPDRLLTNLEMYKKLADLEEKNSKKVIWILNKMNEGVNRKETERFLKRRFEYVQSLIKAEDIYAQQFKGKPIYELSGFDEMRRLAQDIVLIL